MLKTSSVACEEMEAQETFYFISLLFTPPSMFIKERTRKKVRMDEDKV